MEENKALSIDEENQKEEALKQICEMLRLLPYKEVDKTKVYLKYLYFN